MRMRRPFALGSAAAAFVLAGAELELFLYGIMLSLGHVPASLLHFQELALPASYIVAAAAAGAKFLLVSRRAARLARANEYTEPLDLETLRARLASYQGAVKQPGQPEPIPSRTRQLLDERRARSSGAAGSALRR